MRQKSFARCGHRVFTAVLPVAMIGTGTTWALAQSTSQAAPTWAAQTNKTAPAPSTTAKPTSAASPAGTGWGSAHTASSQTLPSQSAVLPAPAARGWATVKPGRPVSAGTLNVTPPGTHQPGARPASPAPPPGQARTVSCQVAALHPGWRWTISNHSTQTFAQTQLITFKTHYSWTNPNLPASAYDTEEKEYLSVPLAPGGLFVLNSLDNDLNPMTAPPTCEVESIGNYTVTASNVPPPPPPPPPPARDVSCEMTALNPGWKWTVTNHTNQTFTQHQLFTFKTHYPWANPNVPATTFDSEQRIYLALPIAPGASATLLAIHNALDPMTAAPTCEVETVGDYVVQ